jgi:mannosyltransferase OCH1-like enzyme
VAVPRILHQLWKTAEVPARFTALRETWRRHNPHWRFRLWTDADLAALVAERYPELAAIYHGYRQGICRADLGRYLVLETFGGVYADLDCECLGPLDPLLEGAAFVAAPEPDSHNLEAMTLRSGGLTRFVCPSFLASAPGHPLWAKVRERIPAARTIRTCWRPPARSS